MSVSGDKKLWDSAHIPSSFPRLIIFLAGRLRRPRPSAGNANRWADTLFSLAMVWPSAPQAGLSYRYRQASDIDKPHPNAYNLTAISPDSHLTGWSVHYDQ